MKLNRIVDTDLVDVRRSHLTLPRAASSGTVDRHNQSWDVTTPSPGTCPFFCLNVVRPVLLHPCSATSRHFHAQYRKGQSFIQLHPPKFLYSSGRIP